MPPAPETAGDEPLVAWVGQVVVLDTQGPMLYIGMLERVGPTFVVLSDADVHDRNDARATKDLYLAETCELGVRPNRARVMVTRAVIASASLLADVRG